MLKISVFTKHYLVLLKSIFLRSFDKFNFLISETFHTHIVTFKHQETCPGNTLRLHRNVTHKLNVVIAKRNNYI